MAERTPRAEDFPGAPPENLVAGSMVFTPTGHPVRLNNHFQWWSYVHGANWRHPLGPTVTSKAGRNIRSCRSPTKTRRPMPNGPASDCRRRPNGNLRRAAAFPAKLYAWGDELKPGGKWMANIYQGQFPLKDTGEDGFAGIAPVAQFPPNRLRPLRCGRQRVGMVQRLVSARLLRAARTGRRRWRATRRGRTRRSIQPNPRRKSAFIAAVRFSARTSIAPATWSARAAKAKSAPAAIISAFAASGPQASRHESTTILDKGCDTGPTEVSYEAKPTAAIIKHQGAIQKDTTKEERQLQTMKNIKFLNHGLTVLAAAVATMVAVPPAHSADKKPNIVFIKTH